MNIKATLIEALQNIGVQVDDYQADDLIEDYVQDSLSFVSLLLFLEDMLEISIDVKYINADIYKKEMGAFAELLAHITTDCHSQKGVNK